MPRIPRRALLLAVAPIVAAAGFAVTAPRLGHAADPAPAVLTQARAILVAAEAQDLDRMMAFFADDAVLLQPFHPLGHDTAYRGVSQIRGLIGQIFVAIEPFAFENERFTLSADGRTVFIEADGEMAIAATGEPYRNQYVFRIDFDDRGKVARITEYFDAITLAEAFEGRAADAGR